MKKIRLACAVLIALTALGIAAWRLNQCMKQITQEDASVYEQIDNTAEIEAMRLLGEQDEQRRIESLKDNTFDNNGNWKYADPDSEAHWQEQKRILGWK
jgi:hypothetical protein